MQEPSPVLKRLWRLTSAGEVGPRDLVAVVHDEPGLPDRIRRYAGLFYAASVAGRSEDMLHIVTLLGPRVVQMVAVQHALVQAAATSSLGDALQTTLWGDMVRRALATRLLCEMHTPPAPDVAFTAGLAMEFGSFILLDRDPSRAMALREVRATAAPTRIDREKAIYGAGHTETFVRTGRGWGVPEVVISLIAGHHDENPVGDLKPLRTALFLADRLGEALCASATGTALERWVETATLRAGMPTDKAWDVVSRSLGLSMTVGAAIGVNLHPQPPLDVLRGRRSEERVPVRLTVPELAEWVGLLTEEQRLMQARIAELESLARRLRDEDQTTGLPRFPAFIGEVDARIAAARREAVALVLLVIDIDGFTDINVRFGREAGEQVLGEVAVTLKKLARDDDLVGRLGGDKFGVLARTDVRGGKLVAERVRTCLQDARFDVGDTRIRLTCRVFGAALSDLPASANADRLLAAVNHVKDAERAMGGNRVGWYEAE